MKEYIPKKFSLLDYTKLFYILGLHFFLILLVWKTNFIELAQNRLGIMSRPSESSGCVGYHQISDFVIGQMDKNVKEGDVIFVGDSITQALNVASISPRAVNFGIACDTSRGVSKRIVKYRSLSKAKIIVLAIGVNDLVDGFSIAEITANYNQISDTLPKNIPILWNSVLPVNPKTYKVSPKSIMILNEEIKKICAARENCRFVDAWSRMADETQYLKAIYDSGDGLHLSPQGYELWERTLKKSIAEVSEKPK